MPAPKKVKAPAALLIAFGKKSKARGSGGGMGMSSGMGDGAEEDESDDEDESESLPEDFEDYAITAFPELEGEPERLQALYRAMKACAGM